MTVEELLDRINDMLVNTMPDIADFEVCATVERGGEELNFIDSSWIDFKNKRFILQ